MSGHKETHRIILESGETIQRLRSELAAVRKELAEVKELSELRLRDEQKCQWNRLELEKLAEGLAGAIRFAHDFDEQSHQIRFGRSRGLCSQCRTLAAWEEFKKK